MDDKTKATDERRFAQLENIIENHARTERHSERFEDWMSDEAHEKTAKKQENREENIRTIENAIINDTSNTHEEK